MSEISREEVLEYLITVKHTYMGYKKIPEAFDKAISDMQKLDEIEKVVKRKKGCFGCFGNCEGCGNDRYPEIEKIVYGK